MTHTVHAVHMTGLWNRCVVELVIKQLKVTNDMSSSVENSSDVSEIFGELDELLPKVKDMALSAKRSAAADAGSVATATAHCASNVVVCSSRF